MIFCGEKIIQKAFELWENVLFNVIIIIEDNKMLSRGVINWLLTVFFSR